MSDAKWAETIEVFSEALSRKPAAKEMYTNKILESLDEAKQLAQTLQKAEK